MVVPILRPCSSESSVKRSTLVVAVLVEETQGCDTSRCHCKGEESGIMWTSGLLFRKSQVCRLTMSMKREQFLLCLGCRWFVWYMICFYMQKCFRKESNILVQEICQLTILIVTVLRYEPHCYFQCCNENLKIKVDQIEDFRFNSFLNKDPLWSVGGNPTTHLASIRLKEVMFVLSFFHPHLLFRP
jgi:hypothetical protein